MTRIMLMKDNEVRYEIFGTHFYICTMKSFDLTFFAANLNASRWSRPGSRAFTRGISSLCDTTQESDMHVRI